MKTELVIWRDHEGWTMEFGESSVQLTDEANGVAGCKLELSDQSISILIDKLREFQSETMETDTVLECYLTLDAEEEEGDDGE